MKIMENEPVNRIQNELTRLANKEAHIMNVFKDINMTSDHPVLQKERLKFYNIIESRFKYPAIPLSDAEITSMKVISDSRKKLNVKVNGSVLGWLKKLLKPLTDRVIRKQINRKQEVNFSDLKREMLSMGFAGVLESLQHHINKDQNRFTIPISTIKNGVHINYNLSFVQDQDRKLSLQKVTVDIPSRNGSFAVSRFSFDKETHGTLNAAQMINLMVGRPVYYPAQKESNALGGIWLKLDVNDLDKSGQPHFRRFQAESLTEIKEEIAALPFKEEPSEIRVNQILNSVLNGDRFPAKVVDNNRRNTVVFLEMGGMLDRLKITDVKGQEIALGAPKPQVAQLLPMQNNKRQAFRKSKHALTK